MPETLSDIATAVTAELDRWLHGRRRKRHRIIRWSVVAGLAALVAVLVWQTKRVPAMFRD